MSQDYTEDVKERLVREMTDAPQGTNDSEMPMPGNPTSTGETGPSPGPDTIPAGDLTMTEPGSLGITGDMGEVEDPGDANAGGVNANNTDGTAALDHPMDL